MLAYLDAIIVIVKVVALLIIETSLINQKRFNHFSVNFQLIQNNTDTNIM